MKKKDQMNKHPFRYEEEEKNIELDEDSDFPVHEEYAKEKKRKEI